MSYIDTSDNDTRTPEQVEAVALMIDIENAEIAANDLLGAHALALKNAKEEVFKLYDKVKSINDFIHMTENETPDSYEVDCDTLLGSFCYYHLTTLFEFIKEYLEERCPYLNIDHKTNIAQVCYGNPITINRSDRKAYFVYDHGSSNPIIEKYESWMTDIYILAVIHLHQLKLGEFNDVITLDYYGHYVNHFSVLDHLKDVEGIETFASEISTDDEIEQLETFIKQFEKDHKDE